MENRVTGLGTAELDRDRAVGRLEHARHLVRLAVLLVAVGAVALTVRSFLVPATFGEKGRYRGAAERELAALPTHHLGDSACNDCHEHRSMFDQHAAGKHKDVACEACHGPARGHAIDAQNRRRMVVDSSPALCLRCHAEVPGRPRSFPQVNARQHLVDVGEEPPPPDMKEAAAGQKCTSCHDAHEPSV